MTTTRPERDLSAARYVGEQLHELLWRKRRTQREAALAAGVGTSTFSKKIRGEVPVTVDELVRICRMLEVEPAELLPRLDSNQQPFGYPSLRLMGWVLAA